MANSITIFLHFLTFTFGFTALVLFSRRFSPVSPTIKKYFIHQALYYNLTIIFMAIGDFIMFVYNNGATQNTFLYSKEVPQNMFVYDFGALIHITNNVFAILWCMSFILLVYSFLEIPFSRKSKKAVNYVWVFIILIFIYSFFASHYKLTPYLLKIISWIFCYTIFLIWGYSIFLYRKSANIGNIIRRGSLRIFSILFIIYSSFSIFHYVDGFHLHILPPLTKKLYINSLDLLFNSFLFFWGFKYFDSLSPAHMNLKDFSEDQLVIKFQISKRELEVIRLICAGKSNQEIADTLFISLGTVKNHLYNIYLKLGIKNRTQLAKMF